MQGFAESGVKSNIDATKTACLAKAFDTEATAGGFMLSTFFKQNMTVPDANTFAAKLDHCVDFTQLTVEGIEKQSGPLRAGARACLINELRNRQVLTTEVAGTWDGRPVGRAASQKKINAAVAHCRSIGA